MLLPFITALAVSAAATPLVIWLARRMGWVVAPREDRWHTKPTAVFGGVAIFLAFLAAFVIYGRFPREYLVLLACSAAMFVIGLYDDAREMRPQVKLLCQILVACTAVSLGIRLDVEVLPWPWLSIPLAVLWLVGITNAVNILDNMDGLSSGTVMIAAGTLALGSAGLGDRGISAPALMLAGAAAGFLIYNFNPAKIFMGDCGSLFLGFCLASLAILSTNTAAEASHLVLSLLLPLGALVVPIFDTTLVSVQRSSHGRSIAQGGRDHSSHRLVFLGLSEKRAVLLLLAISAAGGAGSLLLLRYASPLVALLLAALFVIPLLFFGIYLGEVRVYQKSGPGKRRGGFLSQLFMHKKQMLQMLVDLAMLTVAYTGAWLLRFEGQLSPANQQLLAVSLPWVLAVKMAALWAFRLYRGQWRYVSVYDLVEIIKACLAGTAGSIILLVLLFRFADYSRAMMVIDFVLCVMLVAGNRSLIRVFREKVRVASGRPALIVGAGDGGEMLLRELKNNPLAGFKAVGFIDDDPAKAHQVIHGVPVLGSRGDLESLIQRHQVSQVFICIFSARGQGFEDVFETCRQCQVRCSRIEPMIKL